MSHEGVCTGAGCEDLVGHMNIQIGLGVKKQTLVLSEIPQMLPMPTILPVR